MLDIIIIYSAYCCIIFYSPLGFCFFIIIMCVDLIGCKERLIVSSGPSVLTVTRGTKRNPVLGGTDVEVICKNSGIIVTGSCTRCLIIAGNIIRSRIVRSNLSPCSNSPKHYYQEQKGKGAAEFVSCRTYV